MRNKFDLLVPNNDSLIRSKAEKQIENVGGRRPKDIKIGDKVMAKDFRNVGEKLWSEGEVVGKEGNAVLDIKTADSQQIRRHSNHDTPKHGMPIVRQKFVRFAQ